MKADKTIEFLNKRLKELGSDAQVLKGNEIPKVEFFTSGVPEIDEITGGVPKNRITEIFGFKGVGKTFLAKQMMGNMDGLKVLYIDTENALDKTPEHVTTINEHILETIAELVNASLGKFDIVIVDSVASMVPKAEYESETGEYTMGLKARLMGQWMRKVNPHLAGSGTALVFINQQRDTMDMYGPKRFTPGGKALPYASSLRLELKTNKADRVTKNGEVVGHWVHVEVEKSKVCRPWQKTKFKLVYDL